MPVSEDGTVFPRPAREAGASESGNVAKGPGAPDDLTEAPSESVNAPAEPGDGPAASDPAPVPAASVPPARRRAGVRALVRRLTGASFSIGVMGTVALLAIGTTTPGAAVAAPRVDIPIATDESKAGPTEIQAYVTAGDTRQPELDRVENYGVVSMAGLAAASGVTMTSGAWINDPNAAIQWPFPVGVPISAEFGSQDYQAQFSTPHGGTDFTPGAGAEIHVIAAGTVRIATEAGGDYGVTVLVDHVVDGQLISSRYGHMQYGSLQVKEGDTVQAGQVIGRVGSTGRSTGPHLHLELLVDGLTKIDAMAWLRAHTS